MKELQVVSQQELLGRTFTTYGSIEEPLFLAKNVAELIDYDTEQVGKMLKTVDEDEKIQINTRDVITGKGNPLKWFLTEKGLYQVLVNSRKTIAKQILEDLDLGFKIKYKRMPKQTEFTFMLSHFLQEHVKTYAVGEYNPIFVEEFSVGKYRLDYYFLEYGIIVEYDEKAHKYRLEEDKNREREIKKILGDDVKFIRVQEGKEFEGIIHIISELIKKFNKSIKQDT